MKDDILKHLYDIRESAEAIFRFVKDKTFNLYDEDELLRSAVERKFMIIGEALNRIKNDDPASLDNIRHHRNIISFRNILVHGYDSIDNRIVWGIINENLGHLVEDINILLDQ
jgi:uncharacterized protein with HEPN domain